MAKEYLKNLSWGFWSKIIILIYGLLQVIRWLILPQFMDIYYHILTAWGFLKAGGYSSWDFWQYAPVGRIHIYPPVFHLILAVLMKFGISTIILAKLFETITPVAFLIVLWNFIRKNYNEALAFFVMLTFSSSFSYYLSLLNHIPATLAFIFGFLAVGQIFQKQIVRSLLLLTLCFYTHIGISWFFALSLFFYGLFNKEYKKISLVIFISALILSLPILFKQLTALKFISNLGLSLQETYLCQIKIIDYALAFFGLILAFKADKIYRLFLSFFLASLIFLIYPYRFFSNEGFMPIVLLSALTLYNLYERLKNKVYVKYLSVLVVVFILFLSPTLSLNMAPDKNEATYKLNLFDSAFVGMLFVKGQTIWFPKEYLSAAALVKDNSEDGDVIYSSLSIVGMILSSISERATANALFPEIGPSRRFDPFSVSKIIIFTRNDDQGLISRIINNYNMIKIGENKLFIIYKNPSCHAKANIKKASVPFWAILLISFLFISLFWRVAKQKNYLT